jgi:dCTP deaminase
MSILCDNSIARLVQDYKMIEPFTVEQLNPASYDLQIGPIAMVEHINGNLVELELRDGIIIGPGERCLAQSMEKFNIPSHVAANILLKSSRAREGWDHAFAGWCDPGWHGSVLTLELRNTNRYRTLILTEGMLMVQMIFHTLDREPNHLYKGKYNNNSIVARSYHE